MAKNDASSRINKLPLTEESLSDALMDLPACHWIKENLKPITYGILIFFLLLLLLYRLLSGQSAKQEQDYLTASHLATVLQESDTSSERREAALKDLKTLLEKSTPLQAKYDALIGEQLLIGNQAEQAQPYIERTLQRVQGEDAPAYIKYAATSLILTQGKQELALKDAYSLKEDLLKNAQGKNGAEYNGVLYAFNLIRIASLEKAFKNQELETKAWNELQQMNSPTFPIHISPLDLQRIMSIFTTK